MDVSHSCQTQQCCCAWWLRCATGAGVRGSAFRDALGIASRDAMARMRSRFLAAGTVGNYALGVILLLLGLLILTGADKRIEALLVQHSPAWLTDLTTRY